MFDYNALLKEMSEVEDRIAARDLREREAELEIAKQSAPPPQLTTTLDSTPGPARPTALKPRLESIPHELKEISNWVLWRYEPPKNPNGKWRKVPYQPNGYKADTTNPHTWSSFETVCAVYELGNYDGIGFVFDGEVGPDGTCLAGIDLDRCMDAAKSKFQHLALERIKRLRTYTEASPSGTGLHMIARTEPVESVKTKEFELYTTGRYFTFTGRKWDADQSGSQQPKFAHLLRSQGPNGWLRARTSPRLPHSKSPRRSPISIQTRTWARGYPRTIGTICCGANKKTRSSITRWR